MKKKIVSLLLVMLLAVTPLCSVAYAAALSADEDYVAYGVRGTTAIGFDSLEAAIERLKNYQDVTIYLVDDDDLTSTEVTIPSGITVVIATSADYEKDKTTTGNNVSGEGTTGTAYATLGIPSTSKLIVDGSLIVAGNQQSATGRSGFLTGNFGAIKLDGSLEINGTLYARGKISGGETGFVTANSGSSVYERFQISDWRGGNASKSAFDQDIFPFNLYELGGIDSKLVLHAGASLYGQSYVFASTLNIGAAINVPYIGGASSGDDYTVAGSIIAFSQKDDTGNITLTKNSGRTTIALNNVNAETGNISYTVKIFGIPFYDFTSAKTVCPFGYNTDLTVNNSTVDIKTKVKFLPGCTFTVGTGSTLNITSEGAMCFYSEGVYQKAWCNYSGEWGYGNAAVLDATGGTVNNEGILASSSATFDNLLGLGTLTDGGTATVNEVTQSGTTVTVVPVTFYKAVLPTTDPTTAE